MNKVEFIKLTENGSDEPVWITNTSIIRIETTTAGSYIAQITDGVFVKESPQEILEQIVKVQSGRG